MSLPKILNKFNELEAQIKEANNVIKICSEEMKLARNGTEPGLNTSSYAEVMAYDYLEKYGVKNE